MFKKIKLFLFSAILMSSAVGFTQNDSILWYMQPAKEWTEGFEILVNKTLIFFADGGKRVLSRA